MALAAVRDISVENRMRAVDRVAALLALRPLRGRHGAPGCGSKAAWTGWSVWETGSALFLVCWLCLGWGVDGALAGHAGAFGGILVARGERGGAG